MGCCFYLLHLLESLYAKELFTSILTLGCPFVRPVPDTLASVEPSCLLLEPKSCCKSKEVSIETEAIPDPVPLPEEDGGENPTKRPDCFASAPNVRAPPRAIFEFCIFFFFLFLFFHSIA